MKKFIRLIMLSLASLTIISALIVPVGYAQAATRANQSAKTKTIALKNPKLLVLAEVDLSEILPYIMVNGDVIHEHKIVTYKNKQALRLRIFNKNTGKVRYVYIDNNTGEILK